MNGREIILNPELCKVLNSLIKYDSALCWYKTNNNIYQYEFRSRISTISNANDIMSAFTSEELKSLLIPFCDDISYSYEEKYFYFIDWNAPLLNEKALPKMNTYISELDARANLLIYLIKLQK